MESSWICTPRQHLVHGPWLYSTLTVHNAPPLLEQHHLVGRKSRLAGSIGDRGASTVVTLVYQHHLRHARVCLRWRTSVLIDLSYPSRSIYATTQVSHSKCHSVEVPEHRALCDGWHKMLTEKHLVPTVTKRAQGILCNPLVPKLEVWYQTTANLVPKSLPHGAKVATHWYQSSSLVPKLSKWACEQKESWCETT